VAALGLGYLQWTQHNRLAPVDWDLALVGRDGSEKVLSYAELLALPTVETAGGFFSSVGTIYGPFRVKGIPLETLLDLVGGMTASDLLQVSARDGYSMVFDYRQLQGDIDTFAADTLRLVPGGAVQFLLIFEQDGQPLAENDGAPLRLAIINPDGLLTEGHWWVLWVTRLGVRAPSPAAGSGN